MFLKIWTTVRLDFTLTNQENSDNDGGNVIKLVFLNCSDNKWGNTEPLYDTRFFNAASECESCTIWNMLAEGFLVYTSLWPATASNLQQPHKEYTFQWPITKMIGPLSTDFTATSCYLVGEYEHFCTVAKKSHIKAT